MDTIIILLLIYILFFVTRTQTKQNELIKNQQDFIVEAHEKIKSFLKDEK
jgi:uncharacterized membrane protein YukC